MRSDSPVVVDSPAAFMCWSCLLVLVLVLLLLVMMISLPSRSIICRSSF